MNERLSDKVLMQKAYEALLRLTSSQPAKMQYSEIMLIMVALKERLSEPDHQQPSERQLQWAKGQADHWKQHCFHLMKQLQEKKT